MKKIFIYAGLLLFITSCGSELEQLTKQKEELITTINDSKKELEEIEIKINELDTTEKEIIKTKVSVVGAEKRTFEHYFEIQGAIEADKNVIVVPEAAGLIKSLNVKEGQTITEGQTIAVLDAKIVNASKKEIEEQLELAEYMYNKQKSLFDQGIGTEVALKQAETQYEALKKSMNTIGAQEAMYTLKAPFTGYVEEVFATEGSMAGPASPIIRLIGLNKMSVKADISEVYVKSVDNKSMAQLRFPAIDQEVNNVSVSRLGKFVNPANRTVVLEIDIPNPTDKMIPNMMSVIKIRDYYDTAAVVIPSRTILRDMNQEPYVFVYNNGIAVETKIKTGQSSEGYTQVLEGIALNNQVIDKGSRGIKNNQEIVIQ